MDVIQKRSGHITNFEVHKHIKSSLSRREEEKLVPDGEIERIDELQAAELAVISYIEQSTTRKFTTEEEMIQFIKQVAAFGLTKAELLQILNLLPTSEVYIHAIVEECSLRLSDEEVTLLLKVIEKYTHQSFKD